MAFFQQTERVHQGATRSCLHPIPLVLNNTDPYLPSLRQVEQPTRATMEVEGFRFFGLKWFLIDGAP